MDLDNADSVDNADMQKKADNADNTANADNADQADNAGNLYMIQTILTNSFPYGPFHNEAFLSTQPVFK